MERDILTSSFMDLRDKLHHIALRYLQNDEDAKDVLQESWLKLKLKIMCQILTRRETSLSVYCEMFV